MAEPEEARAAQAGSGSGAEPSGARPATSLEGLWRLVCSLRLALTLILVITVACLAGALLMQAPAGLSQAEYAQWLDRARVKYGALADPLSALGLFGVFHSWWFRLLLGLLVVSLACCTLDRWPRSWRAMVHPNVRAPDSFYLKAANRASFAEAQVGVTEAPEVIAATLRGRGYRVRQARDGESVYLYADRHWFGRLGTYLNHLSLVLLLAGTVVGGVWGFREKGFAVPEGSTREVGYGTDLAVKAEAFVDEYYPEGPPKDYRSDLVLYERGAEVKRQTIRVNEPLSYKGVRFHQSSFGPAVVLQVKTLDGTAVFDDGIALDWRTRYWDRPLGIANLPGRNLTLTVQLPRSARSPDSLIPAGQVRVEVYRGAASRPEATENLVQGRPTRIGDLELTFVRERQYTGLQVVKDPGGPLVWLASGLMVVGLGLVFYFPHRRLWIRCQADATSGTQVHLAAPASRAFSFAGEFRDLAEAARTSLEAARGAPAAPLPGRA